MSRSQSVQDQRQAGVTAWSSFLRVHAAVVRVLEREVEQATGLPLSWYDALLELNAAPDRRLRMRQLGERVVLSRTRVSRVVDELVAAGLVERLADPDDGRAVLAAITQSGRRALRKAAPVYLSGIERHFARHLSSRQLAALTEAMERVLQGESAPGVRG